MGVAVSLCTVEMASLPVPVSCVISTGWSRGCLGSCLERWYWGLAAPKSVRVLG